MRGPNDRWLMGAMIGAAVCMAFGPAESIVAEEQVGIAFGRHGDSAAVEGRGNCDPCVTQASGFAGGSGTQGDPYLICNAQQLANVSTNLSAHYQQCGDISLDGILWTPIGDLNNPFQGTYDGAGFTIDTLTISLPSDSFVGLFGALEANGAVRDLAIVCADILAGSNAGGVAGRCFGEISNVVFDGTVTAFSISGGIAGLLDGGTISHCRSSGAVISDAVEFGGAMGGLVGISINDGTISFCHSDSMVQGVAPLGGRFGGLLGDADSVRLSNCCATGAVTGGADVGGLVGGRTESNTFFIENCYASGAVSGTRAGGLVGGQLFIPPFLVTASFWDTQNSGQATSMAGVGKTTAEMQMQATFDPPWDFTNTWTLDEGNDYPRLRTTIAFADCNSNGVPDPCEPDCNTNATPDDCELAGNDCNSNGVLDACDITGGTSPDTDGNGVPDECQTTGCIIISEIMDGTLTGGTPKYVEITNTGSTDFIFIEGGLIIQANLSTDLDIDVNLTGVTIPAGDSFVIVSNQQSGDTQFATTFGFAADLVSAAGFGNGNDRYILAATDDASVILDSYGENGVDGFGTAWEYTDSFAFRLPGFAAGRGLFFDPAEWDISPPDSLDGVGTAGIAAAGTPKTHTVSATCDPTANCADFLGATFDLPDLQLMQPCLLGPQPSALGFGCPCFDFDTSGTVDLKDFGHLTVNFGAQP